MTKAMKYALTFVVISLVMLLAGFVILGSAMLWAGSNALAIVWPKMSAVEQMIAVGGILGAAGLFFTAVGVAIVASMQERK
jgi:hypothetical protein